jgi:hypothetical protein
MKTTDLIDIASRFQCEGVEYLIAGGYAVVAHGYVRFTADLDVVLELSPDNIRKAFDVLKSAGFRPAVPVGVDQFSDPDHRENLIREKGMQVLNFFHADRPQARIDLFVQEPFPFQPASDTALVQELPDGTVLRFVNLDLLMEMKREAGRPKDLIDLEYLQKLKNDSESD